MKKEWSRDWKTFDWDAAHEKLIAAKKEKEESAMQGVSLKKEDLFEYIEWLWENEAEEAEKLTLGLSLYKAGLSLKEAEMCAARPELLYQVIDEIMQERDNAIE